MRTQWAILFLAGMLSLSAMPACYAAESDRCAARAEELRRMAPPQFTIVVQPPFVVLGDGAAADVRQSAERTVKWATEKLKKDYFAKDPENVVAVWLFKDKESYEKHVRELFNDTPISPFGYYSSGHNALFMNISTGGGTLLHEMVHPFMHSNFPACPAWFNEGLASLYERSSDRAGHIVGHPNWRLPALQQAQREGTVPSFKALTATTTEEFYGRDRVINYAQARYLCYYLQEKGLLVKFFKSFQANAAGDPTGYETLRNVLGEADMEAFQKTWAEFILKLRYG